MKKVLLLVSVLWLSLGSVYAQVDRCGTMANHAQLLQEDPSYGERRDAIEQMIQKRMANDKSWRTSGVITIPVVFHILYSTNNATQNITLARIQAQLDVLIRIIQQPMLIFHLFLQFFSHWLEIQEFNFV